LRRINIPTELAEVISFRVHERETGLTRVFKKSPSGKIVRPREHL
jgi:hypothetical protein